MVSRKTASESYDGVEEVPRDGRGHRTFLGYLPVGLRVNLLIALAIGALAALAGSHFVVQSRLEDGLDRRQAYQVMRSLAADVEADVLRMRQSERDFLLRKNPQAVADYERHGAKALATLEMLVEIPEADPLGTHIDTINDGIGQNIAQFHHVVEAGKTAGGVRASDIDRLDEIFDYVGPSLENLVRLADEGLAEAALAEEQRWAVAGGLMPLSPIVIGLLFLALALALGRSIAPPLARVAEAASSIGDGDTTVFLPALGNRDEIGEVARALQGLKECWAEIDRLSGEYDEAHNGIASARPAAQTATATGEVGTRIGDIQAATRETVDVIQGIGTTIGEINAIAAAIASAVAEQGSAIREMARNVERAVSGAKEATTTVSAVSRAAGEAGAGAERTLEMARALIERAASLRAKLDRALAGAPGRHAGGGVIAP